MAMPMVTPRPSIFRARFRYGSHPVWTGVQLARRSAAGLMDASLPESDLKRIEAVLASYRLQGLEFHAVRTRQAGTRAFVTMHVLVPGAWTVQRGHDWSERIESELRFLEIPKGVKQQSGPHQEQR